MENNIKKRVLVLIIFSTTMILSWVLPEIYKTATEKAPDYPISFYSSVADKFYSFIISDNGYIRTDLEGNIYTQQEFDSLLPMVYTSQLVYDNRMPKKIKGETVDLQKIRITSYSYKYRPRGYQKPSIKLYPLFESMSKRVDLDTPNDVFRISDNCEFINIESNEIDIDKSNLYNKALSDSGFNAPAKQIAGIPTARKNYDEGYFILDNKGCLFHMKCVNGKPFIKKIDIDKSINIEYFEATEYPDRAFYGFLFDSLGQMYILTTDNYTLQKIDIPPFDIKTSEVIIMANMYIWNVKLKERNSMKNYAIDAKTKKCIDHLEHKSEYSSPHWIENIFPFSLSFKSKNDEYVKPRIEIKYPISILFNIAFVIIYLLIRKRSKQNTNILSCIWISITGIYGFIACVLLNSDIN